MPRLICFFMKVSSCLFPMISGKDSIRNEPREIKTTAYQRYRGERRGDGGIKILNTEKGKTIVLNNRLNLEKLRQQHIKDTEEKDKEMEELRYSTQKKVRL